MNQALYAHMNNKRKMKKKIKKLFNLHLQKKMCLIVQTTDIGSSGYWRALQFLYSQRPKGLQTS
jgi:hypothetical protein